MPHAIKASSSANNSSARTVCDRSMMWSRAAKQMRASAIGTTMIRVAVMASPSGCGALFTGVIGTLGAVYVYELDPDQVSPELEWPSWMIYLAIPLGSYLMCFRFLQVMWRFLRTGYVPHQGHGIEYEEPHDKAPLGETAPAGEAAR